MHVWPGNARELRNVLTRAAVKCRGTTINIESLEFANVEGETPLHPIAAPGRAADKNGRFPTLDEVECEHIRRALAYAQGHKGKTCDLLGISRPTLTRKIKRYALDKSS